MRGYTTSDRLRYWFFKDRIPLTKALIVSNIVTYLAIQLFKVGLITEYMGFVSLWALSKPWTAITYPFIGTCCPQWGALSLIFSLYWLWVAGGSLERSWGTRRFAGFFLALSSITAAGLYLASLIISQPIGISGLMLPLAGLTVAFAMLNPEEQVLFIVIPIKLKYLALLDVVLVFVSYGKDNLVLGLFALLGCAFAYWYVVRPRPAFAGSSRSRGEVVRIYRGRSFLHRINPFANIKKKRDEERLRKLFGDDER